jgi:hypothetical protein
MNEAMLLWSRGMVRDAADVAEVGEILCSEYHPVSEEDLRVERMTCKIGALLVNQEDTAASAPAAVVRIAAQRRSVVCPRENLPKLDRLCLLQHDSLKHPFKDVVIRVDAGVGMMISKGFPFRIVGLSSKVHGLGKIQVGRGYMDCVPINIGCCCL